jgi:hypothetical protein
MEFDHALAGFAANSTPPALLAEHDTYQIVSLPDPLLPGGQRSRFAGL